MSEVTPYRFSDEEKANFKANFCPRDTTAEQWNLFIQECERRALIPGKHVVFRLQSSREWDPQSRTNIYSKKPVIITTIDALRVIAERAGNYEGHRPFIYHYSDGATGTFNESKIPLGRIPHGVSVELFRKGWKEPLYSFARYDAYVQMKEKDGKETPTQMWERRGEEQLAKCALAAGLREVAPEDCGGLYIQEEMPEAPAPENEQKDKAPIPYLGAHHIAEALAATPTVNQAAAEPAKEPAIDGPTCRITPVPPLLSPSPDPAKEAVKPLSPPRAAVSGASAQAPVMLFPTPEPEPKPAPIAPRAEVPGPHEVGPPVDSAHYQATDDDLPEFMRETPPPAPQAAPVPVTPAPAPAKPAAPAQPTIGNVRGTDPAQYNLFMGRATKVIHNLAAKQLYKGDSRVIQTYLLKDSGKSNMLYLTPAEWEAKLKALETVSLEAAAAILKGAK